jgi:hypothetical protein
MTFYKWKISWLNLISIALLIVSVMMWQSPPQATLILADEAPTDSEEEEITWAEYEWCTDKLMPQIAEAEYELTVFIMDKFLEEKWNSEIVEEVSAEIREKFDALHAERKRIFAEDAKPDGYDIGTASEESLNCTEFIAMRERTIWAMTQSHNIETAGAKSSYMLVDKLKDINDGLREMNMSFGQVLAGFKQLSNKLTSTTK